MASFLTVLGKGAVLSQDAMGTWAFWLLLNWLQDCEPYPPHPILAGVMDHIPASQEPASATWAPSASCV